MRIRMFVAVFFIGIVSAHLLAAPAGQRRQRRQNASAATSRAASQPASRPAYEKPQLPANWDGGFFTPTPDVKRDPRSGIYAIWYTDELLDLPFVKGGQVMEVWGNLSPAEGKYDFSRIDKKLEALSKRNLSTTIQVNGGSKPKWLFEKVPYHPEQFVYQVQDAKGTLMFWHPTFEKAYLDFIAAFADHIRNSPYKKNVLGVRLNFNAIGTEATEVSAGRRDLSKWIVPDGVEQGPPYTDELGDLYQEKVVDTFIKSFEGVCTVFMRGTVKPNVVRKYRAEFDSGKIAWFYTGMSQLSYDFAWGGPFYNFFLDCRPGKTLGYGEPFGDAWGNHGGRRSGRPHPPATIIWWQTLQDLHVGLSFVACYGADLQVAYDGTLPAINPAGGRAATAASKATPQKPSEDLKEEFIKAFQFGAKYAGYHASPRESPGAWIALRQTTDSDDMMKINDVLKNDCTFLMKRLPGKTKPVEKIGDAGGRFYGYARVLPAGETMELVLDPIFAESIAGRKATVTITSFDKAEAGEASQPGSLSFEALGQSGKVDVSNSGQWQQTRLTVEGAEGDRITLTANGRDATLHMIEVTRD